MLKVIKRIYRRRYLMLSLFAIAVLSSKANANTIFEEHHTHETINQAAVAVNPQISENTKTKKITFEINVQRERLRFNLNENDALVGSSSFANIQDDIRVFKGSIEGVDNSWARFTLVKNVMSGAYFDGDALYFVSPYSKVAESLSSKAVDLPNTVDDAGQEILLVINAEDIEHNGTCTLHDDMVFDDFNYDNFVDDLNNISSSSAANKELKITLVADLEFVNASNNAVAEMVSNMNIADGIFSEQVGVRFSISDTIELNAGNNLSPRDPIDLINQFRFSNIPNPGVRHLFTGKDLVGSTVGIAYVGSLCRSTSVGITQRFGSSTALILAHELGHNFGSPHDNQSGSACSSVGSGFVMSPNINTAGNTFSTCSVERMQTTIQNAVTGWNACMTELSNLPPVIVSTPNLSVELGDDYLYDSDRILDINGTGPFTYSLDFGPTGMILSDEGALTWTPTEQQVGTNPVQMTVTNQAGRDTQYFEIEVIDNRPIEPDPEPNLEGIDFSSVKLSSYGLEQDLGGSANIGDNANTLNMLGNTWKSIPFDYEVTKDTILEFNFYSGSEGDIHGIGFDNDGEISPETSFNLYGTQRWGIQDFNYITRGQVQTITIPVGEFFTGRFDRLVFINDHDVDSSFSTSSFTAVKVYEKKTVNFIDLTNYAFEEAAPEQDIIGTVQLTDQGKGVEVNGNRWRKIKLNNRTITPNTVLEFEFKSTAMGEIHGLGFFVGNTIDPDRSFQLFGDQAWAIQDYNYNNSGDFESFVIPIGQYFTSDTVELTFIMDNDVDNPISSSHFRNIIIREK